MAGDASQITLGVDTHSDNHVAAALDQNGRLLDTLSFSTRSTGHRELLSWANRLGTVVQAGLEGTGGYGAGLSRYLRAAGIAVIEVDRPNRQARRTGGKTDAIDAEIAARAVLSGALSTRPKAADGNVESLRVLRVARRGAMRARTQAANQLHALVVTAPDELRGEIRDLTTVRLVKTACAWRVTKALNPTAASKVALRSVARRYRDLTSEISALDVETQRLVSDFAPNLLALPNVGPETAAALLVAAGDNPQRLKSESAFAHMCGVAPLEASSGKSHRHRLNRGGNREGNCALYTIALGRMWRDPRTRAYVARRTAEGRSKREIIRCLKRFIAREVYHALLVSPLVSSDSTVKQVATGSDVNLAA